MFLEAVLMPSLERGRLGVLQAQLESLDPTLEGWSRYLIASCQLLQRRGHFHTIYQLQQFMPVSPDQILCRTLCVESREATTKLLQYCHGCLGFRFP